MKTLTKATLLIGALALAACTNADRFGDGTDGTNLNGAGANTGVDPNAVGVGALDPSSPEYFNQTVGNKVLFAVDQSTLTAEGRQTLAGQAAWLQANPSYIAVIEGHADEQGTREYNLALGARRSNAVREYLVSQGIAGSRMRTLTYGKERPLAACSTEACYAQNRRAVTIISAGGLS
ncbi:peptidoglycan-associated lipoprotein Pal [Nereida sp. MMG025]|uniref:peptidoglycan-associated lipoprotein Pal n=1 Tax=Nereida sp. MMG025 TaxID=2909981 RepID=UPI001F01DBB3|nr:peptidoglycan-associated lipoprotein Pal [Nereida sp. MMG025]MCF6444982.1 peptidoglycan-associated lipoprotein Pal [Nereida sp. MMG025]